ncbi:MAG: DSD1 family PLP-dependent enzyme [Hyphomicrobiaceae bacterium]
MSQLPPATPGMPFHEVDTPALIIDLDAFEGNLERMAAMLQSSGARLRAHAKTHKSPIIARKQMALGAVGVCCQKVSEAEVLVAGGVDNIIITNEVVGQKKIERVAALARQAKIAVCVDNAENVAALATAAERAEVRLDTLVEIDVGAGRCGVPPGQSALQLVQEIDGEPSLRFAGLQAYHGSAQHLRTPDERKAAIGKAIDLTRQTVELLRQAGFACDVVGGAGTGTFELEAASGVYTELQAGSYVFMDADYARNRRADGGMFDTFDHALFVLTTVMSRPSDTKAIVDAGHKAVAVDSGPPVPFGLDGVVYARPSDEHGVLDMSKASFQLGLGQKLLLVPGHCDPTVNLHDWYVCIRGLGTPGARVEAVWPVAARGALY